MSRLIVKNIPKHLKEVDLATHFSQKGGTVTDAKIMYKNDRSRKFGFVGFKNEEQAKGFLTRVKGKKLLNKEQEE